MRTSIAAGLLALAATHGPAAAQDAPPPGADKNINHYLVDITAGAVSALGLVGAPGTTLTPIETSQDLVLALTPFASGDGGKKSFGLAITPARTTLLPMSGRTYVRAWYTRLLGNLTLSYAQHEADHGGQAWRKSAAALDTVLHFDVEDDPVYQASREFKRCADATAGFEFKEKELNDQRRAGKLTNAQFQAELLKLTEAREKDLATCRDQPDMKALNQAKWNAGRMSISYGQGRLHAVGGGPSYSLGKAFNVNAQHGLGTDNAVLQLSLRHARDAVDTDTLGSATPAFKSSRLAALRYTYGDQESSSLRAMAEVSSARSSNAGVYRQAFMVAVGLDKKITNGTWLEFRLGRNRSLANGDEQTSGLLTLTLAPTLFEFRK